MTPRGEKALRVARAFGSASRSALPLTAELAALLSRNAGPDAVLVVADAVLAEVSALRDAAHFATQEMREQAAQTAAVAS